MFGSTHSLLSAFWLVVICPPSWFSAFHYRLFLPVIPLRSVSSSAPFRATPQLALAAVVPRPPFPLSSTSLQSIPFSLSRSFSLISPPAWPPSPSPASAGMADPASSLSPQHQFSCHHHITLHNTGLPSSRQLAPPTGFQTPARPTTPSLSLRLASPAQIAQHPA